MYSQRGHEHKARLDNLNSQIRRLGEEVKTARQNAERPRRIVRILTRRKKFTIRLSLGTKQCRRNLSG